MGFTLRGPQAIIFESIPSKPSANSGHKLVKPEVSYLQMPLKVSDTIVTMFTYSQAAQSDKTKMPTQAAQSGKMPTEQQKADQHFKEPVKYHKKRKYHRRKS